MNIIGVGGTNGSGKDTIGELLRDNFGWLYVSVSEDLIIPELKRRGLPPERQHMAALSTEWRGKYGDGAVVDKAMEKFEVEGGFSKLGGLAVASLRHPGEADRIHEVGGRVVWVDADPKIRYERTYRRGQGAKDQKTPEQFLAEQAAEMDAGGRQSVNSVVEVKAKADIQLENNGNDLEAFKTEAIRALGLA